MRSVILLCILLATGNAWSFTPAECHSFCANPNHPNCVNSGSKAPKESYLPFLSMLKAVPGTELDFDIKDTCKRTTTVTSNTVINSGEDCNLKSVQSAYTYFVSLVNKYEGQVNDGVDQDGKNVKQIEFSSVYLPEYYAKDPRGALSYHYGKEIDSVTYNSHGMLLGTDEVCIFAPWGYFK